MMTDIIAAFLYDNNSLMDPRYFWVSIIVLWIYAMFFIALPRIRDTGMDGRWLLLYFIPIANIPFAIILLFRAPNFSSDSYCVVTEM